MALDTLGNRSTPLTAHVTTATTDVAPTSEQLIDAAVAAGQIDAETGLVYRVFALYGDPRLPAAFQGNDETLRDSHALEDAVTTWSTLSSAARSAIGRYLLPPLYQPATPGAANALAKAAVRAAADNGPKWDDLCALAVPNPEWTSYTEDNSPTRVWWNAANNPGDAMRTRAQLIHDQVETKIRPTLDADLGATPISDQGGPCNGGDGKLDVYLADNDSGYHAVPLQPRGQASSGFIVIRTRAPSGNPQGPSGQVQALAHEYMHLLQYTFPWAVQGEEGKEAYGWFAEASAQWAMDRVYPTGFPSDDGQLVRMVLEWTGNTTIEQPLDAVGALGPVAGGLDRYLSLKWQCPPGCDGYWNWLFVRYLTGDRWSNVGIVRTILVAQASEPDALHAVNTVIATSTDERWRDFRDVWSGYAAAYWNQPPVDPFFKWASVPGLEGLVTVPTDVANGGQAEHRIDSVFRDRYPSEELPYLTAAYAHLRFVDSTTREIRVTSPFAGDAGDLQAIVHIAGGDWQKPVPVSGTRSFCRDNPAENIDGMVLIASNPLYASTATIKMITPVTVKTECTPRDFPRSVEATGTYRLHWTTSYDSGDGHTYHETGELTWKATVTMAASDSSIVNGSSFTDTPGRYVNEDRIRYFDVGASGNAQVSYAMNSHGTQPWIDCVLVDDVAVTYAGSTDTVWGYLQLNWLRPYPPPLATLRGIAMPAYQFVLDGESNADVPYSGTRTAKSSGCTDESTAETLDGITPVYAFTVDLPSVSDPFPDANPRSCVTVYDQPPDYHPHTRDACRDTPSAITAMPGGWKLSKTETTNGVTTTWVEKFTWTLTPSADTFTDLSDLSGTGR